MLALDLQSLLLPPGHEGRAWNEVQGGKSTLGGLMSSASMPSSTPNWYGEGSCKTQEKVPLLPLQRSWQAYDLPLRPSSGENK